MSDYNQILKRLIEQIRDLTGNDVPITEDVDLIEQAELDSLKVMDLVMKVEDEFEIDLPINLLVDIHTPGQLAEIIQRLQEKS